MLKSNDLAALVRRYLDLQEQQIAAVRAMDTPRYNRQFDNVVAALDALEAEGQAGRAALEELLASPEPMVRYSVGRRVLKWNPEAAIPVLARLLFEPYPFQTVPYERFSISSDAALSLFNHFGIRSFNEKDLVEPLRVFGVELPPL